MHFICYCKSALRKCIFAPQLNPQAFLPDCLLSAKIWQAEDFQWLRIETSQCGPSRPLDSWVAPRTPGELQEYEFNKSITKDSHFDSSHVKTNKNTFTLMHLQWKSMEHDNILNFQCKCIHVNVILSKLFSIYGCLSIYILTFL